YVTCWRTPALSVMVKSVSYGHWVGGTYCTIPSLTLQVSRNVRVGLATTLSNSSMTRSVKPTSEPYPSADDVLVTTFDCGPGTSKCTTYIGADPGAVSHTYLRSIGPLLTEMVARVTNW